MAQSLSHPEERTPHPADVPYHGESGHEHVPGSMDVTVQERTFEAFMRIATRAAIVIVALLIFLALVNG